MIGLPVFIFLVMGTPPFRSGIEGEPVHAGVPRSSMQMINQGTIISFQKGKSMQSGHLFYFHIYD
ncbi:hypothetical protein DRA42_14200 [Ethanoligenens harbinense]|nr:hypothetical protein CXQ68_14150 [Ethanoligenens harbinense YUAN-3]AYF39912.1 hypothetical protein CXP51_14050 [Ethanoligenens harbinense]AYF42742.1 hypothetical protein CN246_14630 [Ethanoligenens harbinense]QCN93492.1 hypothetical protein DRA42_14200 [Ethanoligenens harbinense]